MVIRSSAAGAASSNVRVKLTITTWAWARQRVTTVSTSSIELRLAQIHTVRRVIIFSSTHMRMYTCTRVVVFAWFVRVSRVMRCRRGGYDVVICGMMFSRVLRCFKGVAMLTWVLRCCQGCYDAVKGVTMLSRVLQCYHC